MTFSRLMRFTATLVIVALLSNNLAFAKKKPVDPAVMKARIQIRGVGRGVRVTLSDTTEVKGLIVSIGDQGFRLKAKHEDQPREIPFAQVTGLYNDRATIGQKVGIGVAIFGAAVVVTAIVLRHGVY